MNINRKNAVIALMLTFMLILVGCSSPANNNYPTDGESRGIFYEVVGGKNQLYLFGTIHVGQEDMYPLHKNVEKAISESDVLGLEIDLENLSEIELFQELLNLGFFQDGSKLSDYISKETFDKLKEILAPMGIDSDTLDVIQPWYAGMMLTEVMLEGTDLSSEEGVEYYLIKKAESMEIIGLETIADQLNPYALLTMDSQVMYLENSLEEMEHAEQELYKLVDAWKRGDVDFFTELRTVMMQESPTPSYKKYQEATLDGRDTKMTEKIVQLLEGDSNKTYFIAVGTLHLVGENSIVDQLRRIGYEVNLGYEVYSRDN